jgi:hypothetical protein
MATTSSGKLLAIVVVGILVMMISVSLLAPLVIETRPTPQQLSSPELREARTEAEEQSYMQLLNNITATTTSTTTSASVPPNQTLQIIQKVRDECESGGFLGRDCVSLVFDSPRTIVVGGALLTAGSTSQFAGDWNNPFIWKAVDSFKELGYSLTTVELGGQGIENNPHTWYVVMSK